MARQPRTLLEVCVDRASGGSSSMLAQLRATPKGARVCQYVAEWGLAIANGCEPSVIGVARYWREAEATAYRRNRDFRELFPSEPNPERIARRVLAAQSVDGSSTPAKLMQVSIAV